MHSIKFTFMKNSISSRPFSYEPNSLNENIARRYALYWSRCCKWNVFLHLFACTLYFVYCDTLKKLYRNRYGVGSITLDKRLLFKTPSQK